MTNPLSKSIFWAGAFLLGASLVSAADGPQQPWSLSHPSKQVLATGAALELASVDQARLLQEDADAFDTAVARYGASTKRLRVAVDRELSASPIDSGVLRTLGDGSSLWRLQLRVPGATDLRLGFDRFEVPAATSLFLIRADGSFDGPFGAANRGPDGSLWLPFSAGNSVTVELHAPAASALDASRVRLSTVAAGYRNFSGGELAGLLAPTASGACNVDVACPLGDAYRNEIRSVARMIYQSGGGSWLCTGSLVNNTSQDLTPYFLTANHCISTPSEAASLTTYWNYESPTCGQHGGGSLSSTMTGGGTLMAHRADVDVSLLKLSSTPPESYQVYYAGWDASNLTPDGAIGIHHPSGDVKAITEDNNGISTVNSCIGTGGNQSHWRTGYPYAQGTTEGGSSGSQIVVPAGDATGHGNLIIGFLSGGSAACSGSLPNSGGDCYGKVSVAWTGSSAASRLKDWLDPGDTGALTQPGVDPADDGGTPEIAVTPPGLSASVPQESTDSSSLSVANVGSGLLSWSAEVAPASCGSPGAVGWLGVAPPAGNVSGGGSSNLSANYDTAGLAVGAYTAVLCIQSNDAATPLVSIPVSLTVTPADLILCSGFEVGEDDGRCIEPLPPPQAVQDPSYEATTGDGDSNPYWHSSDTNGSGTPFYANMPRTGAYSAWGGGWRQAGAQNWWQSVTLASGGPHWLTWWRFVDLLPNGTATLVVSVDGTAVSTFDVVAHGIDGDWQKESVDVSAWADGGSHEIRFTYSATGSEDGNLFVDDVTVETAP